MIFENHDVAATYLTDCVICTGGETAALILGIGLVALIVLILTKI